MFIELVGTYPTRGVHSLKSGGRLLAALVKIVYCKGYRYIHRYMYTSYIVCTHIYI